MADNTPINTEFDDAEKMYEAIRSEIVNFKTKHPGCEVHLSSNDASIRLHEGLTFGLESSLVIQRRKDYNLQQKATQNS